MASPDSSTALKITSQPSEKLTKTQKLFNTLTARIEKLRAEAAQSRTRLQELDQQFRKLIFPWHDKLALAKMEVALALDRLTGTMKLSKHHREEIRICILDLIEDAMDGLEPQPSWVELSEKWTPATSPEAMASESHAKIAMMEALFGDMFGQDVDWEALQNDPENAAKVLQELMDQQNAAYEAEANARRSKKAQAQHSKRAEKQKAAAELQSRSVRSIYISLAKLLHPDLESDPALRAAKEEQMKQVSAAYEANDLATLLQMELSWLQRESDHLAKLPEDKLRVYIDVLKGQERELEAELAAIRWDPAFSMVQEFVGLKPETVQKKMRGQARQLEEILQRFESLHRMLRDDPSPKDVKHFVKEYVAALNSWF